MCGRDDWTQGRDGQVQKRDLQVPGGHTHTPPHIALSVRRTNSLQWCVRSTAHTTQKRTTRLYWDGVPMPMHLLGSRAHAKIKVQWMKDGRVSGSFHGKYPCWPCMGNVACLVKSCWRGTYPRRSLKCEVLALHAVRPMSGVTRIIVQS